MIFVFFAAISVVPLEESRLERVKIGKNKGEKKIPQSQLQDFESILCFPQPMHVFATMRKVP